MVYRNTISGACPGSVGDHTVCRTEKKTSEIRAVICVLLGLMGLSGCATAELEERNFPIEMAVSDMEQFDREWLNADESGNRMVDYSHMKVILLDQKFFGRCPKYGCISGNPGKKE